VGVVMRVWHSSADVLLLTDPNSNLDVFVLRNRRRGVLQGGIGHVMQFKYFDRGAMLLIGDDVVTSGLTGAFPSNVPVGKIVRILPEDANGVAQTVDVEPIVNLDHLTNVLVLQ
jgi:rod shape-determining protein MreC